VNGLSLGVLPRLPAASILELVSEYPTGRTGLGDDLAAWLAQNPASPINRSKRAAEEEMARAVAEAGLPEMPDIPKDVDDMSSEDWTELNNWCRKVRSLPKTSE
jgi:hypothetical protein